MGPLRPSATKPLADKIVLRLPLAANLALRADSWPYTRPYRALVTSGWSGIRDVQHQSRIHNISRLATSTTKKIKQVFTPLWLWCLWIFHLLVNLRLVCGFKCLFSFSSRFGLMLPNDLFQGAQPTSHLSIVKPPHISTWLLIKPKICKSYCYLIIFELKLHSSNITRYASEHLFHVDSCPFWT